MDNRVQVVIPTFSPERAEAVVRLLHGFGRLSFRSVVVCNSGRTYEVLANRLHNCKGTIVLTSHENLGYGGAANLAANLCTELWDTMLLANDDVLLSDDAFERIASEVAHMGDTGILGFTDGADFTRQYSPPVVLARVAGVPTRRSAPGPQFPMYLTAIRREAFESLGGFDELRFPLYFEDADLLQRAELQNVKMRTVAVGLLHEHSATARLVHDSVVPLLSYGALQYAQVHLRLGRVASGMLVVTGLMLRLLIAGVRWRRTEARATLAALRVVCSRERPALPKYESVT